ncbi:MAG: DEAD/DEAH box helicase [Aquificae bacterium]|nr:DEAD/DEAH box helicase [Aquificota bacterium]
MSEITFKDLPISKEVLKSIEKKGFKKPTEIQKKAIPIIYKGKDLIAQAQTGTGKTAAFGIPIVDKINPEKKQIQALILVPTRELAIQVAKEIKDFGRDKKLFVLAVYGGKSIQHQIKFLKNGKDTVIVGTPGRVRDLIERGILNLKNVKIFVLDEADRMLDMGFIDDIRFIFNNTPKDKQTLLFSATMPPPIKKLAKEFLKPDYEIIQIKPEKLTVDKIKQYALRVNEKDQFSKLTESLSESPEKKAIIFIETKKDADKLANQLRKEGFNASAIHGDFSQNKREKILKDFRQNKLKILVATDVAARGLDIKDIDVVYNYSLPRNIESYVHRIGRTGRAGRDGVAISIIKPSEDKQFSLIVKKTKANIELLNFSEKPINTNEKAENKKRKFLKNKTNKK